MASVALVALGGLVAATPSSSATSTRRLLQFNMAGNTINRGGSGVVDAIVRSVHAHRLFAVTLNEVCANQARNLDGKLGGYEVYFHQSGGTRCDNGEAYGNAVVHRSSTRETRSYTLLPTVGGLERRGIVCVHLRSPDVALCSTHLTNGGTAEQQRARDAQVRRVASIGAAWARSMPTFIGGDFNATPPSDALDVMYRRSYGSGATGVFNEAEGQTRSGASTHRQGKLDYGWLSTRWTAFSTSVANSDRAPGGGRYSDHKLLFVTARI